MNRSWSVGPVAVLVVLAAGGDLLAQTTGLTFSPGSSVRVEQLVADCDWQSKAKTGTCAPTANQTTTRSHGTTRHNKRSVLI